MSPESERPFSLSSDKPLRMKAVTLGAIIVAACAGAIFAENLRRDVQDQGMLLHSVVNKQNEMSYKLDRLDWSIGGKRGPAPDKP